MAKTIKRLGRGLDSLVSNLRSQKSADNSQEQIIQSSDQKEPIEPDFDGSIQAKMLAIDDLHPNPYQPRNHVDQSDIESLANSIKQSGLLQPVSVRLHKDRYEIIAGERRWHAAKHIGMKYIPVVLRDTTDQQMIELALIENIQREDLNAIDRAKAYREFSERFHLKPEEIGLRLSEDRSTVINYLRLLDLPQSIQDFVSQGRLSMGHARCLLGLSDDAHQIKLAESAIQNELSVRALEHIVQRAKSPKSDLDTTNISTKPLRSPHIHDLQKKFEQAIQTKVTIKEGKRKGSGRVIIEYFSFDDFERIAERLQVDLES